MKNTVIRFIAIVLVIIDLIILYFWITDSKKVITNIGLTCWIGSIVLGVVVYLVNRSKDDLLFTKKTIFITTLITIALGVLSLLIEFTVRFMP